jgi:DNA topoisomerase-1
MAGGTDSAKESPVSSASNGNGVQEAREAGLRYVSDARPGITRVPVQDGFDYFLPDGSKLTEEETLGRIRSLAIPPAWTEVWICPLANGHIQATGRDARGRKQYRYHPRWREQRDENKFQRIMQFARVLPKLRRRVQRDLRRRGMPREKVLATVVRLLEATLIRVGNDEYARHNRSYGLTTLRNQHVRVNGNQIGFSFKGKSGKRHHISVRDQSLARIVRRCQDMPGQELFVYEDENGTARDVTSQDVNEYLREVTGQDFTAKDFRTWAGTVLAALALREFEKVSSQAQAKKNVLSAVQAVAQMLGNTPTVCRKCYVHPEILSSYLEGDTIATIEQKVTDRIDNKLGELKPEEAAVLVLLKRRLKE